ncbi:permease-like cell division protein FtsX [Nonomuraea sediminis]|uniref:permease-like cell division protein FtsX n=1 Tax=Nonomuraea sediminis TaxID=2835864 RepID=UPI001BDD3A71|nr:permease-like cell division protein FtsX [Nonomuraea sediminis]
MNSPVEERLRQVLDEAGATVDVASIRPLTVPERRRFRVDFRLITAAAGVALAGAIAAVTVTSPGGQGVVAAKPVGPEVTGVRVFLCVKGSAMPQCKGKGVTAEQTKALQSLLKSVPYVDQLYYEDQATAYKNFQEANADNQPLIKATRVTDMPTSFRVKLKTGADPQPVVAAVTGQPGVAQVVVDQRVGDNTGKSDIGIVLCKPHTPGASCATLKDGVSTADVQAIQEKLAALPETKTINLQHSVEDGKLQPASIELWLKPGADRTKVIRIAKGLHGVQMAFDMRCSGGPSNKPHAAC